MQGPSFIKRFILSAAFVLAAHSVLVAAPAAQKFPFHLYFGETHNHTIFSFDYKGPEENSEPIDAYRYARDVRKYDFFVITDHNFDKMDKDLHKKGLQQADEATVDGKFVAIYGTEFNRGMKQQGHINIFDPPVFISWADEDVYVDEGDIKGVYKAIKEHPGPFGPAAQFNHPFAVNFDEFEYDKTGASVMKLIETSNGQSELPGYEDMLDMYHENVQTALSKGWRLGFSASDDHHDHGWGTVFPETTGLFAKELTRREIISAIQNRRSYSMNDTNAFALFMVKGRIMGTSAALADGNLKFYMRVDDPDAGEGVKQAVIYYGVPGSGKKAEVLATLDGAVRKLNVLKYDHVQPKGTTFYYYVRVTQTDGNFIMLSPVWLTVR